MSWVEAKFQGEPDGSYMAAVRMIVAGGAVRGRATEPGGDKPAFLYEDSSPKLLAQLWGG